MPRVIITELLSELIIIYFGIELIGSFFKVRSYLYGFFIVLIIGYFLSCVVLRHVLHSYGFEVGFYAPLSAGLFLGVYLSVLFFLNKNGGIDNGIYKKLFYNQELNAWVLLIFLLTCLIVYTLKNEVYSEIRFFWYSTVSLMHIVFCVFNRRKALAK